MLTQRKTLSPDEKVESELFQLKHATKAPASQAFVLQCIDGTMKALLSRIKELEQAVEDRLDLLEHKSMRYHGVWRRETQHVEGDLVTHRGGLWYCKEATVSEPGKNSAWQLTAKTQGARGKV